MNRMDEDLQAGMKLTIFVGGDERRAHRPVYEVVLAELHRAGIPGATVTKGVLSYGQRRRIHSTMNEVTMENLPLVIEAVAAGDSIEAVAPRIAELLGRHGLVAVQKTAVFRPTRSPGGRESG